MFTGIVQGAGRLRRFLANRVGGRITIEAPFSLTGLKKGESIAINGCCLTVTKKNGKSFEADLSHETLRVTNLGGLRPGDVVNLERPVRLSDRLGGHLVQGHVDGVGKILGVSRNGKGCEIRIGYPASLRRFFIPKGSVAVDGVSMTINRLGAREFTLVVVPHTLRSTNLGRRSRGDAVNLEVDMVAKYMESLARKKR